MPEAPGLYEARHWLILRREGGRIEVLDREDVAEVRLLRLQPAKGPGGSYLSLRMSSGAAHGPALAEAPPDDPQIEQLAGALARALALPLDVVEEVVA